MPRKPRKPPYTTERQIPGAFEGETVTRRRLMVGGAHLAGATATIAIALPALGFALGPVFEEVEYVPRVITQARNVGQVGKTTVYMRKHNAELDPPQKDDYDQFVAISTRCMHLGCPVRYVQASE